MTSYERWEYRVQMLVERAGFIGILLCASIPNPLFDLAGITCGHFLVPFWTFFGATLIGKAIIKMHIQKVFVILAFNETLLESAIELLRLIPVVGEKLEAPIREVFCIFSFFSANDTGTGIGLTIYCIIGTCTFKTCTGSNRKKYFLLRPNLSI